jgi:hypothetical protein
MTGYLCVGVTLGVTPAQKTAFVRRTIMSMGIQAGRLVESTALEIRLWLSQPVIPHPIEY